MLLSVTTSSVFLVETDENGLQVLDVLPSQGPPSPPGHPATYI